MVEHSSCGTQRFHSLVTDPAPLWGVHTWTTGEIGIRHMHSEQGFYPTEAAANATHRMSVDLRDTGESFRGVV